MVKSDLSKDELKMIINELKEFNLLIKGHEKLLIAIGKL
jgi:hypothetical protein